MYISIPHRCLKLMVQRMHDGKGQAFVKCLLWLFSLEMYAAMTPCRGLPLLMSNACCSGIIERADAVAEDISACHVADDCRISIITKADVVLWLQTFVYTLCQMAIRPTVTLLLGLGPSRRMQEMMQPAALQQAMTEKES